MNIYRIKDYNGRILAVLAAKSENAAWAWAAGRSLTAHHIETLTPESFAGAPIGILVDVEREIAKLGKDDLRRLGLHVG